MDSKEIYSPQNRKREKLFLNAFAIILFFIGVIIMIRFYSKIGEYYSIASQNGKPNMDVTGQIGDFVGGVVGTLFAMSGTLLIYLSFKEQNSQNKRESFESSFFEMLRIQRENVSELKYSKFRDQKLVVSENRKVFKLIFDEFNECFREVSKFYRFTENILIPEYKIKLEKIQERINPNINLKEMALIDIAYSIVFFGIGEEGEKVLRFRFKNKYIQTHIFQLLQYVKLKPKRSDEIRFSNWLYIKNSSVKQQRNLIAELYNYKRNILGQTILSKEELRVLSENNYEKYYGGHQFRLGHYFRHLFQTYKYLHFSENINITEKYFYAKTLRAQLSNYEQALLFINSISSLGMKWEFTPEIESAEKLTKEKLVRVQKKQHLISIYNLIKNLPGEKIFGFRYKSYYPEVEYESDE
jgi:hypothetical protein